jgi:hypothetical protein
VTVGIRAGDAPEGAGAAGGAGDRHGVKAGRHGGKAGDRHGGKAGDRHGGKVAADRNARDWCGA